MLVLLICWFWILLKVGKYTIIALEIIILYAEEVTSKKPFEYLKVNCNFVNFEIMV